MASVVFDAGCVLRVTQVAQTQQNTCTRHKWPAWVLCLRVRRGPLTHVGFQAIISGNNHRDMMKPFSKSHLWSLDHQIIWGFSSYHLWSLQMQNMVFKPLVLSPFTLIVKPPEMKYPAPSKTKFPFPLE